MNQGPITATDYTRMDLARIRQIASANAPRVARLGEWPSYISAESITSRIPEGEGLAPGFDAGLACTLDIIPRVRQDLAAKLHAAYTPDAVAQVRREIASLTPDSETCWWLACCSICKEGSIDVASFRAQLEDARRMQLNPELRMDLARREFEAMISKAFFIDELGLDVPFGTEDGNLQGAYLRGYPFAVQYAAQYGLYFIGTTAKSLGLENFPWSDEKDEEQRPKSGPVWGSLQFVKCKDREEMLAAIAVVRKCFANELAGLEARGVQRSPIIDYRLE